MTTMNAGSAELLLMLRYEFRDEPGFVGLDLYGADETGRVAHRRVDFCRDGAEYAPGRLLFRVAERLLNADFSYHRMTEEIGAHLSAVGVKPANVVYPSNAVILSPGGACDAEAFCDVRFLTAAATKRANDALRAIMNGPPIYAVTRSETAFQQFLADHALHPYSWWRFDGDAGDGPPTQANLLLPRQMRTTLRIRLIRVSRQHDRVSAVHTMALSNDADDADDAAVRSIVDSDERALLRTLFDYWKSDEPHLIAGLGLSGTDFPFLMRRARVWGLADELYRACPWKSALLVDLDRERDARAFVARRLPELASALDGGDGDDDDIASLVRLHSALTLSRLLERELFTHAICSRELRGESRALAAGTVALHCWRMWGLRANPPRIAVVQKPYHVDEEARRAADERKLRDESREKPGGYNPEPATGLHSGIVTVYDFASFYPSIIASYNIGHDTVLESADTDDEAIVRIPVIHAGDARGDRCQCCRDPRFWSAGASRTLGVIAGAHAETRVWARSQNQDERREDSRDIKILPASRRRSHLVDMMQYLIETRERIRGDDDIAADVCKLIANSVFGMLGRERGDHPNPMLHLPSYRAIALLGRAHLLRAACLAQESGDRVVYGDTDSIFVAESVPTLGGRDSSDDRASRTTRFVEVLNDRIREAMDYPALRDAQMSASESGAVADYPYRVHLRVERAFRSLYVFSKKVYAYLPVVTGAADGDMSGSRVQLVGFPNKRRGDEDERRALARFCVKERFFAAGALDSLSTLCRYYANRPSPTSPSSLDVNASWHAADAEMSGHFARSDFFKQKWSCVKDAARELICRYHCDTASKNARVSTTVHDYI
ncbi:hypothetical protein CYMTET_14280 [Cymbomonas tetramitiformis]|uniref:DNA polymerase n=1 Tax=Cymbomonas tetramitiformis TaxID=36881 RepID=A0AAE0LAB0_9CHLO|nr:hypothetical protein CYMTET_14280 [Cymbomonas tetramitiformis]